jgi:hypothetical protein
LCRAVRIQGDLSIEEVTLRRKLHLFAPFFDEFLGCTKKNRRRPAQKRPVGVITGQGRIAFEPEILSDFFGACNIERISDRHEPGKRALVALYQFCKDFLCLLPRARQMFAEFGALEFANKILIFEVLHGFRLREDKNAGTGAPLLFAVLNPQILWRPHVTCYSSGCTPTFASLQIWPPIFIHWFKT